MGVNLSTFRQLAALSARFRPQGRSLVLGRQKFRLAAGDAGARDRAAYDRALRDAGLAAGAGDLVQADGYAETLFRGLGFGEIEVLDRSDFEGAALRWDLNRPVPAEWHRRYALIFDGGTLEHVFDVSHALRNIWDMLQVGGRFVSATPFNGYPGHGFYQFGPELVWSYWQRGMGCTVHACRAIETEGSFVRDLPDPKLSGRRLNVRTGPRWRGRMPTGRVLLWYEIEKTDAAPAEGGAFQSDYVARWDRQKETA